MEVQIQQENEQRPKPSPNARCFPRSETTAGVRAVEAGTGGGRTLAADDEDETVVNVVLDETPEPDDKAEQVEPL